MNTEIKLYENKELGSNIRTAQISCIDYYCIKDVCDTLGGRVDSVLVRIDEDDTISIGVIDKLGRKQNMKFVNESGLYDIIVRSDSPKAKPFRKWITHTVIPSIRKNGGYILNQENMTTEQIEQIVF